MVEPAHLQRLTYLAGLPDSPRRELAQRCWERHFERGGMVVQESEPCVGLFFVIEGRVKVFRVSPEGREQILRIMGPGETFNDVPAFDGGPNPASVQAMEPSIIGLVPSAELERIIVEHPQVARHMLRLFAGRLRGFVELVSELSLMSVESRVARLLLVTSGTAVPAVVHPKITQQELAAMVGTTREVAARALRSLEDRGAIRREEGATEVLDRKQLEAVAEGTAH